MDDLTKAVMQAKSPLEYLRAEVALLRNMDNTSGDADWMEKAADEIERLWAVIRAIARIVENPDNRALQRVRDITDKHSSDSAPGEADG